ncbi:MAG: hypothetical protein MI741_10525, partial [Rhodospirillales bacterium]|nr:hypothetical protein [Rhodospirillales bacterium]
VGQWHPRALSINDQYLGGMKGGLAPCFADDHIVGHHCWNYLMAARAFSADRPGIETKSDGRTWFPEAKLLIERRGGLTLYSALNKGGVFKIFRGDRLVASDTQFSVKTAENPPRNAVGHLVDDYQLELGDNEVRVGGSLGWAKQKRMTTINLVALRLIMVFGGRFFPNLIRRLLQRMLITGKSHTSFRFKRFFRWEEENLVVEDRLETEDWDRIKAVALGCDQTSIYVVMSRTFQAAQLEPWIDLTPEARGLGKGDALTLSRKYEP